MLMTKNNYDRDFDNSFRSIGNKIMPPTPKPSDSSIKDFGDAVREDTSDYIASMDDALDDIAWRERRARGTDRLYKGSVSEFAADGPNILKCKIRVSTPNERKLVFAIIKKMQGLIDVQRVVRRPGVIEFRVARKNKRYVELQFRNFNFVRRLRHRKAKVAESV